MLDILRGNREGVTFYDGYKREGGSNTGFYIRYKAPVKGMRPGGRRSVPVRSGRGVAPPPVGSRGGVSRSPGIRSRSPACSRQGRRFTKGVMGYPSYKTRLSDFATMYPDYNRRVGSRIMSSSLGRFVSSVGRCSGIVTGGPRPRGAK